MANDTDLIAIKKVSPNSVTNYSNTVSVQYPMPYFNSNNPIDYSEAQLTENDIFSNETLSGLSDSFKIYILDSELGNYWEGLKPLDYMPEGWKNGYSRGICINEEKGIVIYWVIIW